MSLGEREDELLDTLEAVIDADLPYVLVGGWAIAAFNQRFTTDVDVVIPAQSVDDYTDLLTDRGYEKTADIERNERYEGRSIRFAKRHRESGSVRRDGRRARVPADGGRVVVSLSGPIRHHRAIADRTTDNSLDSGTGAAVCRETS